MHFMSFAFGMQVCNLKIMLLYNSIVCLCLKKGFLIFFTHTGTTFYFFYISVTPPALKNKYDLHMSANRAYCTAMLCLCTAKTGLSIGDFFFKALSIASGLSHTFCATLPFNPAYCFNIEKDKARHRWCNRDSCMYKFLTPS